MQTEQTVVREHQWFGEPTRPVSRGFIAAIVFARFVFFVALLGPARPPRRVRWPGSARRSR